MKLFFPTVMVSMATLLAASLIALGVDASMRSDSLFYRTVDANAAAASHAALVERMSVRVADASYTPSTCSRTARSPDDEHVPVSRHLHLECIAPVWGAL